MPQLHLPRLYLSNWSSVTTQLYVPTLLQIFCPYHCAQIESVLSDIPFFCVGILAFGVSTIFLITKRGNLCVSLHTASFSSLIFNYSPAIYLYISALLAFVAAILDLSQVLARGRADVDAGLDQDSVTGLVNTREVAFALSVGFRFLFFWVYVAQRPRGEPAVVRLGNEYDPREHSHSASWQRWGYLGFLIKWKLLALIFSIPIIQIFWRIVDRRYGVVYMVETTIEIVVSALLFLKILLSIFLSPVLPWWRPFHAYAVPLLALGLNLGISITDLISCELSFHHVPRIFQLSFEI